MHTKTRVYLIIFSVILLVIIISAVIYKYKEPPYIKEETKPEIKLSPNQSGNTTNNLTPTSNPVSESQLSREPE